MIDFYVLTSPNVQKIFIMLEELAVPYRPIPVDVWQGEQFKPEFTALNPNAKIPVIVDPEGPGGKPFTVFESGAILMYLADKFGRSLPAGAAERYEVIQWLMLRCSSLPALARPLARWCISCASRRPVTIIQRAAT